jgi:hypothetical protein
MSEFGQLPGDARYVLSCCDPTEILRETKLRAAKALTRAKSGSSAATALDPVVSHTYSAEEGEAWSRREADRDRGMHGYRGVRLLERGSVEGAFLVSGHTAPRDSVEEVAARSRFLC